MGLNLSAKYKQELATLKRNFNGLVNYNNELEQTLYEKNLLFETINGTANSRFKKIDYAVSITETTKGLINFACDGVTINTNSFMPTYFNVAINDSIKCVFTAKKELKIYFIYQNNNTSKPGTFWLEHQFKNQNNIKEIKNRIVYVNGGTMYENDKFVLNAIYGAIDISLNILVEEV